MTRKFLAALALGTAMAGPALAQGSPPPGTDAIAAARTALESALAQAPLSLPVALFVKERPAGYGIYDARDTTHFKPGEPLFIYLEPQGYKYKDAAGVVTFGLTMDFEILNKDGNILGGKEKFLDVSVHSHHRNTEFMLTASLNIQNAPPGDYQLELVVHDQSSADVARTRLPFTIDQ